MAIAKTWSHGSSVEFSVIVVICGFTKIASAWDLSPSWHIPQQTSRGYAVDAIIQILIEIYSIRLKLKQQIILTDKFDNLNLVALRTSIQDGNGVSPLKENGQLHSYSRR